ncbi:MAG TPA: hypothetical protein VFZ34_13715 [Blastocatellia bacterium]|nr:hypothetical protein [Blastocatellia bacterium]
MKRFVVGSLFVMLLLVSALAQEEPREIKLRVAADDKAQIEMSRAVGTGTWIEMKTVKGAPYTATAESETVQMLTDGNRIHNKTTTNIARDSEGRTRREIVGTTPGVPAQVFINDPVGNVTFTLNPKQRTAVKSQVKTITVVEKRAAELDKMATVTVNEASGKVATLDESKRVTLEQKMAQEQATGAKVTVGGFGGGEVKLRRSPGKTESLGQQMIEGVMCDGKRTTLTIPAGTIGNDLPINVVTEEWYSPELQSLVLTKHSDPRHGETTYRLTNINRSEPARSLFEVPVDYTVRENAKEVPVKK